MTLLVPDQIFPLDNADRAAAISEFSRNVVVLAGAGTGKTSLLVDRLAMLILARGTPVEKIVALTFTKKAAEEMRDRLEKKLRRLTETWAGSLPDHPDDALLHGELARAAGGRADWVARAEKALNDLPKAQIGTIHGFAGYLLRLYPLQADVDPHFKEDKGELMDALFDREWLAWISVELGAAGERKDFWMSLLPQAPLEDLKQLARVLSVPGIEESGITAPVDLSKAAAAWLQEFQSLAAQCPPANAPKFNDQMEAIAAILSATARKESPPDRAREAILEHSSIDLPKKWEENDRVASRLPAIFKAARQLAQVNEPLMASAIEAVMPFVHRCRAEARKKGIVSFDGLLVQARNLVQNHLDVRDALKEQFTDFLIDEFQDTDPLQGEILLFLAETIGQAARHWSEVRLEPGRLFVVGDPKQSIYRFRGADIAAFEAFRHLIVKQGAREATLSANFRSHKSLLDAVNGLFPAIMRPEPGLQPAYAALQPVRADGADSGLAMTCVAAPDGEKVSAEEFQKHEGELIADWILEHVRKPFNGREFEFRDCALLLRSTAPFVHYLSALRSRNIPYLAEGERFFYRTPEVVEFLNVLAAIADPLDRLALVGVLRSPVGGLTDAQIISLDESGQLDFRRRPKAVPAVERLYGVLRSLSDIAGTRPVPQVVQAVLDRLWIVEMGVRSPQGEQAVANIQKIAQLASAWAEVEPLTLSLFVGRFWKYRDDERDEGENPLADANFNAVKVMTVHKAKGLEFPVVFLPNLSRQSSHAFAAPAIQTDWQTGWTGLRLPRSRVVNGAMVLLEAMNERRDDAEEIRVFYVAATRAREKMIFYVRDEKRAPMIQLLKEAGAFPSDRPCVTLGEGTFSVDNKIWQAAEITRNHRGMPSPMGTAWNAAELADLFKSRTAEADELRSQSLFVTPSRLIQEPEKPFFADESDDKGHEGAISVGLLCHYVLEHWDFSAKTTVAKIKQGVLRAAPVLDLIPGRPESDRLIAEVVDILTGYFKSEDYARLRQVDVLGRELPFFYELGKGDAPHLMRGVIDLLYRSPGGVVVADYKTTRVEDEKMKDVARRYRLQGAAYQEAVRRALGEAVSFELIFLRNGKSVRL